jgi:hypothetical protein
LTAPFTASREARAIEPAEMRPHRQTVADIKAVSAAIMSWLTDQVSRQESGESLGILGAATTDVADYPPITVAALEALLVPAYIADVPELDGWGNPYDYRLDSALATPQDVALIRSAGEDGVYEGDVYTMGDVEALAEDLVWADGWNVRRPGASLTDLRAKAVRARSEVASVGQAMLSWLTDQIGFAPPGEATGGPAVDLDLFTPITVGDLETLLVPQYVSLVRENDPWGFPYDYYLDAVDLGGPELMAVRCRGKGGAAEGTVYTPGTFAASDLAGDVVWAEGTFVRQPDDLTSLVFLDDFESGDARHWSASAP